MFKNEGTSLPVASQQQLATGRNGEKSRAWACEQEELLELDEVQLATVVGGVLFKVRRGELEFTFDEDELDTLENLLSRGFEFDSLELVVDAD